MRYCLGAIAALTCAIALSACSTPRPYKYALPAESRDMFSAVEVLTPVTADKIAILPLGFGSVPYNSSYDSMYGVGPALAGNLVAGLMIAGANQRVAIWAEEDIQPLRAALGAFQLAPTVKADLDARLKEIAWINAASVKVTGAEDTRTPEELVAGSSASAVLWTPVQYYLSDKADRLVIQMTAHVFPVSNDLKQLLAGDGATSGLRPEQTDILYRNSLSYTVAVEGATTDRVTNVAMWAKDDAAALRTAMRQGSAKLADMLGEELIAFADPAAELPTASETWTDNGGKYVRLAAGQLFYTTHSVDQPLVAVPETERPGSKISKEPPPSSFY